jgi:hypothetical protein
MRHPRDNRITTDTRTDLPLIPVAHYDQSYSHPPRKKTPLPFFIGAGVIGIILIISITAMLSKQFRHQLELSIVRQPTPYTQLYFTSPATLSHALKVDKENTFDFTIGNEENRTYRYTYTVTLDDSQSHLIVGTETVTIGNGESVTLPVNVVPRDSKSRYLISIALEGMNQSIHFYGETP